MYLLLLFLMIEFIIQIIVQAVRIIKDLLGNTVSNNFRDIRIVIICGNPVFSCQVSIIIEINCKRPIR